ncbi:MAG: DMT family transporter [Aliishimia sp.]
MPEQKRILLAILLTLTAIIGFDIMGILVRIMSARGYSAAELSAYRNIFGVIPSLLVMAWLGELQFTRKALAITRWKLALFRGFTVAMAQLLFYTSLGILELATISALAQTSALFVVIFSVVLLGEKVGLWRIFALAVGFAGALWILRPGTESFTIYALLPIAASVCYGFTIVSVRFFDASVTNTLMYLWSSIASTASALLYVFFTSGFTRFPVGQDFLLIFALSLAGGIAVLFLMFAYRMAAPSILAPFSYVGILTAFFFGWIFFDEAPVETLFPGVILIVGAGAVIIWREQFARK